METTHIPGYAEALKREAQSRSQAFNDEPQDICGIAVNPITLRTLHRLRIGRNGYFVPCIWENAVEPHAHARQIACLCSPEFFIPTTFWQLMRYQWRQTKWLRAVRKIDPERFTREVLRFVDDTFWDSPFRLAGKGNDKFSPPSFAIDLVYVADMFARNGYPYSLDEIRDIPLRQLWQFTRVILKREGTTMPNASTVLAADYLASLQTKER